MKAFPGDAFFCNWLQLLSEWAGTAFALMFFRERRWAVPVDKLFNTTIELLAKSIDMRARNHNHLSANIANAETPGYTPRRLSFEGELKEAMQDKKKSTAPVPANPRHIPIKGSAAK